MLDVPIGGHARAFAGLLGCTVAAVVRFLAAVCQTPAKCGVARFQDSELLPRLKKKLGVPIGGRACAFAGSLGRLVAAVVLLPAYWCVRWLRWCVSLLSCANGQHCRGFFCSFSCF